MRRGDAKPRRVGRPTTTANQSWSALAVPARSARSAVPNKKEPGRSPGSYAFSKRRLGLLVRRPPGVGLDVVGLVRARLVGCLDVACHRVPLVSLDVVGLLGAR